MPLQLLYCTLSRDGVLQLSSGGVTGFSSSCLADGASSLVSIIAPFFFWFLGPLLTHVSRSGDVLGISSSFSQITFTPAFKHKTVIVAG